MAWTQLRNKFLASEIDILQSHCIYEKVFLFVRSYYFSNECAFSTFILCLFKLQKASGRVIQKLSHFLGWEKKRNPRDRTNGLVLTRIGRRRPVTVKKIDIRLHTWQLNYWSHAGVRDCQLLERQEDGNRYKLTWMCILYPDILIAIFSLRHIAPWKIEDINATEKF